MRQRTPRMKVEGHLKFLRELPCLICGDNTSTEAANLRMSDARIAKHNAGVGSKADDFFCLPLCGAHHRDQHAIGDESKFWKRVGLDPVLYALRLWSVTGNHELGCEVVAAANYAAARARANLLMAG